jgi:hypothetical protein
VSKRRRFVTDAVVRSGAALGRWRDVERHAKAALDGCERMRAKPLHARICRDVAVLDTGHARVSVGGQHADLAAQAFSLATDGEGVAVNSIMDTIAEHCRGLVAEAERLRAHPALPTRGVKVKPARNALAASPLETGSETLELAREGDYWTVRFAGEIVRVQDGRGMQMWRGSPRIQDVEVPNARALGHSVGQRRG